MNGYAIFKALHLIAMVAWFAGLFYLFRILVYHVENRDKPEVTAVLKTMARKLYRIITLPAMIATCVFGLTMIALNPALLKSGWLHVKLMLVLGLAGYTLFTGYARRRFEADDLFLTSKQCRLWNEAPTLFLVIIIFWMTVFRFVAF